MLVLARACDGRGLPLFAVFHYAIGYPGRREYPIELARRVRESRLLATSGFCSPVGVSSLLLRRRGTRRCAGARVGRVVPSPLGWSGAGSSGCWPAQRPLL